MKLALMLWTAAATAAVTIQLLAAASLEMEEKELEDALATREVEVDRRERRWQDQQQMILLDAMGDAFQSLLRLAKRLSRKGKGGRRGRGRKFKDYEYDEMPFKRNLEEKEERQFYDEMPGKGNQEEKRSPYDDMPSWQSRKRKGRRRGKGRIYRISDGYDEMPFKRFQKGQGGDDAKESVAEQDAVALCRDFLNSQMIGEAAVKAKGENKEQVGGKQEEIQEEGKEDKSQEEVALKDLVQIEKMLELCLELLP